MKKLNLLLLFSILFISINACKKDEPEPEERYVKLSTISVSNITDTTAESGGYILDDGGSAVTARGVCYSTSVKPTIADNVTTDGTGTGGFTSNLTGLTANTTYYVRAYATNANGTVYGNELHFTTGTTIPTLSTDAVNVTLTTVTSGGNITDDGGSAVTTRGVCYSTSSNPTISDNITTDGSGTGSFTSNITGLTANTTYYVRAYATNANGTAYGNEQSFTTQNTGIFPGQTISVAGGTFMMGCLNGTGHFYEQPQHSVTVSSFSISKYEITNQQYADYMNAISANSNGSVGGVEYLDMDSPYCQINYTGGQFVPETGKENYPVIEVSWYGAKAYSEYYGGRLPTEAEWEFAAGGGNSFHGYTYSGSNTIDDVAWFGGNSTSAGNSNFINGRGTFPVGAKNPNELGIYDMSGNVCEWCNDWFNASYYSNSPSNNPQGPSSGTHRIRRGGCWLYSSADYCRVTARDPTSPTDTFYGTGFRPVFVP